MTSNNIFYRIFCKTNGYLFVFKQFTVRTCKKPRVGKEKILSGQLQRAIMSFLERQSLDGLTGHQLRAMGVMNRLREEKGFVLQRDVEERLCINRSSVCSILNAIEEKGYIERRSSERDARANVISFTPKAEALNKNAIRQVTEAEKLLTEGMTEAQKKQFAEFILLAKENIEGRRETEKSV